MRFDVRSAQGRSLPEPKGIIAVVPAFDEERFIASVVLSARDYADEVVVVDDGSADRTAELAERAGATVLRQGRNGGKAKAVAAGFRYVMKTRPSIVVCLDADAQHDPADIPKLTRPILANECDVVIGSRFLGVRSEIPYWRRFGQHALTKITNALSGSTTSDSQSGFRAFSPAAVAVLQGKSAGLALESEMQFMFRHLDLRIAEVPVKMQYRDGNKRNAVVHGLQVVDAMLSLVARRRPLAFISLPGLILAVCGFILGLVVAAQMYETGQLMVGSSILTALLIIGGLLLGVTGVLLHSIDKFMERAVEEMKRAVSGSDE